MGDGAQHQRWYVDLGVRVAIGLVLLGLLTHFVVRPFAIPSESMEPALRPGDRVTVRVLGVDADDLERGDVIAFDHGATWEEERIDEPNPLLDLARYGGDLLGVGPSHYSHTVKRVIGLPGETVSCCNLDGMIRVDGRPLDEPYVTRPIPFDHGTACNQPGEDGRALSQRCFSEITVPEDSYLVLGDNRAGSADSVVACRGELPDEECPVRFVEADRVVGVALWRWWPLPPGDAVRDPS